MIRSSLICILLIFFAAGCSKNDPASPGNQLFTISGTLLLENAYGHPDSVQELAGRKIYIRVDTGSNKDTSNYFYSVVTGSNGRFTFYLPDSSQPYEIFSIFSYSSSSTFMPAYYAALSIPAPLNNSGEPLRLIARLDTLLQNGLNITTLDAAGNRAGRAGLAIYTSKDIAISDAEALSGNGSLLKAVTDSMGRAFITRLPEDKLYVNSRIISGKDTFLTVAHPLQAPTRKIIADTLILAKK